MWTTYGLSVNFFLPAQMLLFGVETCINIDICNSGMKNKCLFISVFNTVSRMHRSSSGFYWTSCTQKSTAEPTFDEQGRNLNRNMPGLGVYAYVETILSIKLLCPSCGPILFSPFFLHLLSFYLLPCSGFRKKLLPCGRST